MPMDTNHALLSAVGDEMADIRAGIENLADLVSDLLPHCPTEMRADAMVRVQAFDLLIQQLDGLGGLMAALGAGVPAQAALDALTLTELSDRLAGGFAVQTTIPAAAGDLMLFD